MPKDALGHGSNPKGSHSVGVDALGHQWTKNKQKNIEIAKRLIEAQGHKADVYKSKGTGVAYFNEGRGITINENAKFWRDPVGSAARATNLSSNNPEHVIHHEIGHALYDAPSNFISLGHQDLARTHVSSYAAMNPKEFVSEVHAGMKAGKTYPHEVMQAFKTYARPRK